MPTVVTRVKEVVEENVTNEPSEEYCYHNFKVRDKKTSSDLQKSHYRSMSSPTVSWDEIIAPAKQDAKQV
jgi:hypothetical protein